MPVPAAELAAAVQLAAGAVVVVIVVAVVATKDWSDSATGYLVALAVYLTPT